MKPVLRELCSLSHGLRPCFMHLTRVKMSRTLHVLRTFSPRASPSLFFTLYASLKPVLRELCSLSHGLRPRFMHLTRVRMSRTLHVLRTFSPRASPSLFFTLYASLKPVLRELCSLSHGLRPRFMHLTRVRMSRTLHVLRTFSPRASPYNNKKNTTYVCKHTSGVLSIIARLHPNARSM